VKEEPAAKRPGAGSDSDLSPPRRAPAAAAASSSAGGAKAKKEVDSDDDLSPPRRGRSADRSAPQGRKRPSGRHDSEDENDDDLSPPRREKASASTAPKGKQRASGRHDSDSDLSPPRRGEEEEEEEAKMSSGMRAGLVRGSDLKAEAAQLRADRRAAILAEDDAQTGRGAQTVYRNREGAKIGREEWVEQQKKKKKKRVSEYPEQELAWGGGIQQTANKEAEMKEVERIAAQPFARYQPDEKYMEELKGRQDWNDPMRKFEEEKEEAKEREELKVTPKCPHAPWSNRFNIKPGYRWDGKVRGNEFEKKWLEAQNGREFKQREKWKWEMTEM